MSPATARSQHSIDGSEKGGDHPVLVVLSFFEFGVGSVLGIVALVIAGVMLVTAATRPRPSWTMQSPAAPGGAGWRSSRAGGDELTAEEVTR
jgi:hypothetical protein